MRAVGEARREVAPGSDLGSGSAEGVQGSPLGGEGVGVSINGVPEQTWLILRFTLGLQKPTGVVETSRTETHFLVS